MAFKLIIEADTKEMAYVIGLNMVDKLGIAPTALHFDPDPPVLWSTTEAIQFINSLPEK